MFCPSCGTQNADSAPNCTRCGTPLGDSGAAPAAQPPSPPVGGGQQPPAAGDAASRVMIPAILLMVLAGLSILADFVSAVLNVVSPALMASAYGGRMASGILGACINLAMIVPAAVILFGAYKMKSLSSYPLALAAAILAMLPCYGGVCCCLGLPIGIWALVVLLNADVKAAFK